MNRTFLLMAMLLSGMMVGCSSKVQATQTTGDEAPAKELRYSQFGGSLADFVARATQLGLVAVLDKDAVATQPIRVNGALTLRGTGTTITHSLEQLFILGNGVHLFEYFNVVQTNDKSIAFFTVAETGRQWTNTFKKLNITGGDGGYSSSRGGLYNAQKDEVVKWAGTTFENCVIKVKGGCAIAVFSQDGPCKYLHLKNVQLSTDVTHNIYVHPNVSLRFDSVVCLKTGKLAMHHYSGGNEQFYYTARYLEMSRISSLNYAAWEMVTPKNGQIMLTNCNMAPYTTMGVQNPNVLATNCTFYNGGNGVCFTGKIINCKGEVWSGNPKPLVVEGGSFDEINLRQGGNITVKNATIKNVYMADRGASFSGTFVGCNITNLYDGRQGEGKIKISNTSIKNSGTARPGLIQQ